MPTFLIKLELNLRNIYLDIIIKLPVISLLNLKNPRDKWRTRAEKAKNVCKYSSVFDDIKYKHLLPICLQYCLDDVSFLL